ncbi:MAG: hypothetical protein M1820_008775 [Bogoriella megaspora]|nr:MAG: hypothetical protein M1820_008775 [Bogoriella megaspora]
MKVRQHTLSLLVLLLSTFGPAIAREKSFDAASLHAVAPETKDYKPGETTKNSVVALKSGIGTKDAPVDGLDGKPHAGPYVDSSTDEKKTKSSTSKYDDDELLGSSASDKSKSKSSSKSSTSSHESDDDGVMSDKSGRKPPPYTGTEGGVSEKDKDRKAEEMSGVSKGKTPESPKEPIELPDSLEDRIALKEKYEKPSKDSSTSDDEKAWSAAGLEKPDILPDTPKGVAVPVSEPPSLPKDSLSSSSKQTDLDRPEPLKFTQPSDPSASEDSIIQPFHSFILSLTMIIFSEIGDKTFLVAALMAMRHARLVVFSAAFSALFVMTVLSAILGHALPSLLPKRFTSFAAALLFLVFGAKMLREGLAMAKDEGVGEEMKEVEMELEEKAHAAKLAGGRRRDSNISPFALEAGRGGGGGRKSRLGAPPRSPSSSPERGRSPSPLAQSAVQTAVAGLHNLFSLLLSPAWVQTFVMTFLGEWGDRSQIATIAMAAGQDYWWVTGGAVVGHAICTAAAVIGGAAVAGRVSMRVVTLGGACAFLAFGVIYLLEAAYSDWSS